MKWGRRIAARIQLMAGFSDVGHTRMPNGRADLRITRFHAAILNAARASRMRFPVEYGAWAEALLGEAQARTLLTARILSNAPSNLAHASEQRSSAAESGFTGRQGALFSFLPHTLVEGRGNT